MARLGRWIGAGLWLGACGGGGGTPSGGDAAPVADAATPTDAAETDVARADAAPPDFRRDFNALDVRLPPADAASDGPPTDAPSDISRADAPLDAASDGRPEDAATLDARPDAPPDAPSPPDDAAPADAAPDLAPPHDAAPPDALAPDAACVPGPEVCNRRDDNCDGRIDERLRCELYESCRELQAANRLAPDGIYPIRGDSPEPEAAVDVYCDLTTDGGGWTLIGASARQPLDDLGTPFYEDLRTLAPRGPNPGLWAALAERFPAFDLRFACRDHLGRADEPFTVDVSFYGTDWYAAIGAAADDAGACFLDGNVPREDREPPARRNNLTGELLPRGRAFGGGVLEGEDACDDEGDFAVDFDDRGMDGDPADGTDWGEDDFVGRCGRDGVFDGQWFVFARERTPREMAPLGVESRVGVVGNADLARGLQETLFRAEDLPDGDNLPDRLFAGQFDVLVVSRVLRGTLNMTPRLVDALDRFVRQGGGLLTELDGAIPFTSGYAPDFPPPPGAPVPAGWFHAEVSGTGNLGPNTPVSPIDPLDFLFRGVGNPLRDPEGTEVFLGLTPPAGRPFDLVPAANFPGAPPIVPRVGVAPAVMRGHHCGHPVLFVNFDWGDALANPDSLVRDFAVNLIQEASFLPPFDVPRTCPVYLPVPERVRVLVCGPSGRDLGALLPAHFALQTAAGCQPDDGVQAMFVTSEADLGRLDGEAVRAWVEGGGRLIAAGGVGRATYDLLFGTRSPVGMRQGDCSGEPMPAVQARNGNRFWTDVPFDPPASSGCGEDLGAVAGLTPLGGWGGPSVSLGYRDLGAGRFWAAEADFTGAGPALSESGRDLLRYLALGRYQGTSFSGIRLDVPEEDLLAGGFEPCLVSHYGSFEPVADLAAQCDGEVLLLGCRPAGAPDLQVAAMGLRDEVLRDVGGAPEAAHLHNGALWYYDPASSWGFAPATGPGVDRFPCDVLEPRAADRLCWQVSAGELQPGFRCGADTAFDATVERVIFHRRGGL